MNGIVPLDQFTARKKRSGNRGRRIARRVLLEIKY
jgi:hypothetical protein